MNSTVNVLIITSMSRNTIKNHRIHLEDSNLFDRPTPRLVDGLETPAKCILPELFGPELFGERN